MAAYAALVSLMHTIEQIQHHPRPPITLDKEQVESLTEKIAFLQDFLEAYNSHGGNQEVERLQSLIADAAYAAEDVIESHIVDKILADQSTSHGGGKNISGVDLYQGLEKVIQDMDLIKKDAVEIKDKMGAQDQLQRTFATPAAVSSRSPSTGQKMMVGFDDVFNELLDKLIRQGSNRQIIPIVGMGGIGKTTLAMNVFENSIIRQHFDVCSWVTVSQEYSVKQILLETLRQNDQKKGKNLSGNDEKELALQLHRSLWGKRYLIVIDDVWDVDVWERVKFGFPDNNSGSRIIITTRLSKLASDLIGYCGVRMNFLDQDKSWVLLCKTVFAEDDCPRELEQVGMKIAQNCKGLPLAIVAIGGLLAKSKTQEYWGYIAKNLNSIVNLEEDERCFKILYMSYNELPVHLKPCFLYMGIFPEDKNIRVSELIGLWVAEGFLKPIEAKSLEEIAAEYIMDLIDRNLILVTGPTTLQKIKFCKIHDLLRDLCLRVAQKDKFFCIKGQHSLDIPRDDGINSQRRIVFHPSTTKEEYRNSLKSASITRSLISFNPRKFPPDKFRLLRLWHKNGTSINFMDEREYTSEAIFQLVNMRYCSIGVDEEPKSIILSSISLLWNLQTLIVYQFWAGANLVGPLDSWKMAQLRHVEFNDPHVSIRGFCLPDPPSCQMDKLDDFVLWNLQTLKTVVNFKCAEDVVKRIPNIRKLQVSYRDIEDGSEVASHYFLNNLGRLSKLESFGCSFHGRPSRSDLVQNLIFPHSLKELTLGGCGLNWGDMSTKIGSLQLEVLKLQPYAFTGQTWETIEGQFLSLKYLEIHSFDLEYWITESTHFPRLEHLVLGYLSELEEIPSSIGEIPTLQKIHLDFCSDSIVISAKRIIELREEFGDEDLKVKVVVWKLSKDSDIEHLKSLESHNFQVIESWYR